MGYMEIMKALGAGWNTAQAPMAKAPQTGQGLPPVPPEDPNMLEGMMSGQGAMDMLSAGPKMLMSGAEASPSQPLVQGGSQIRPSPLANRFSSSIFGPRR